MLDVRRLRTDFDGVAAALARRGDGVEMLEAGACTLDRDQRALASERERPAGVEQAAVEGGR